VLHLAETIKRLTNSDSDSDSDSDSEIVFIPRPTDDPTIRQPDITLAKSELGWEPQVGYEEGLERTLAYVRAHPQLCPLAPTGAMSNAPGAGEDVPRSSGTAGRGQGRFERARQSERMRM
jgi:hypothetical protein